MGKYVWFVALALLVGLSGGLAARAGSFFWWMHLSAQM